MPPLDGPVALSEVTLSRHSLSLAQPKACFSLHLDTLLNLNPFSFKGKGESKIASLQISPTT